MKNKMLFVTVFAVGVVSGMFGYRPFYKPPCQSTDVNSWNDTDHVTRARMYNFQQRLEKLEVEPTQDTVERLTKEMEAQRGIDDILIKFREAQQAKLVPYESPAGAISGAVTGAIVSFVPAWLKKRKSKSRQ